MQTPHFFPDNHLSFPDLTFEGPFLSRPQSVTAKTRICRPHQSLLAFSGQDMGHYALVLRDLHNAKTPTAKAMTTWVNVGGDFFA